MKTKVISLGGSIIAPDGVDTDYITDFYSLVKEYISPYGNNRFIIVTGGGALARDYQNALIAITESAGISVNSNEKSSLLDWLGIYATRLIARLLKSVFFEHCRDDVVTDPTLPISFNGSVLIASGWKPGFSTDYDAVVLAESFGAEEVINLSNIKQVYSADPKIDSEAAPLEKISWKDFRKIVGEDWTPGQNTPFDPIAAKQAEKSGLRVIVADGRHLDNLKKILSGEQFTGTVIGG